MNDIPQSMTEKEKQQFFESNSLGKTLKAQDYADLIKSRSPYTDHLFSPDDTSLYSGKTDFSHHKKPLPKFVKDQMKNQKLANISTMKPDENQYEFKRLSEIYNIKDLNILKEPKGLKEDPNLLVNDVIQGELGDCYFLSALCSLAENPERIHHLLPNKQTNTQGVYGVKVYLHGEPITIVVDDYVAVKYEEEDTEKENPKIAFTGINPETNNIWPILLEKAWAKLNLNYENTISGNCSQAFEMLSPAPFRTLYHNVHKDTIFEDIKEAKDKNFIVCCDITANPNNKAMKNLETIGLITNHAYSIIDYGEVTNLKGEKTELLQIRNPWGSNEWEGDWSDKSTKWTEETKELLGWEDKEDGKFWIAIEDYLKYYSSTHILRERDAYYYHNEKLYFNKKKSHNFVKINVPKDTEHASFILNQKNERIYRVCKGNKEFENNYVSMIVFKKDKDGEIQAVGASSGDNNRIHVDCDYLTKGDYYVAVNFPYPCDLEGEEDKEKEEKEENSHLKSHTISYRIGLYCDLKGADFESIDKDEDHDMLKDFLHDTLVNAGFSNPDKDHFEDEGEKESWRANYFGQKGGACGYITYCNESDGYINEIITFTELHNVNIKHLLKNGEDQSLKTAIESSEEENERKQLSRLDKHIDLKSTFEILEKPKNSNIDVSSKNPIVIKVTIAPHSTGVIVLEKYNEDAFINFESGIVITYPLHNILSEKKFPAVRNRVKYNNKIVEIYETVIEHNSGVIIKYKNKTRDLVFGTHIKFPEMNNLRITLNSDELIEEQKKAMIEDEEDQEAYDEEDVDFIETQTGTLNEFNIEVKDPKKEVALIAEPGETKFVQLSAKDEFDAFNYSLESTYFINISRNAVKK